jgi:hypothetical protein
MGGEGTAPPFLTSALDGGGQLHDPAALPLGKESRVPIGSGSWVDLRAGLEIVELLPGIGPRPSSP